MLKHLHKYDIILGSKSPRRSELLAGLNLNFRVATNDVDESFPKQLIHAGEITEFLANIKADAYTLEENTLLITADTIVFCEGKVYGKPVDYADATRILQALSGKTHQVVTGVSIRSISKSRSFHVTTDVNIKNLSKEEIDFYLKKYKPYDKAGAYAIQEWIGYIGVEGIKGSYFNVMGLPVQRLYRELTNWD